MYTGPNSASARAPNGRPHVSEIHVAWGRQGTNDSGNDFCYDEHPSGLPQHIVNHYERMNRSNFDVGQDPSERAYLAENTHPLAPKLPTGNDRSNFFEGTDPMVCTTE